MYLSRLILNLRSRAVQNDLVNCQGLHRTLLSAFPDKGIGAGGARRTYGLLYRLEEDQRTTRPVLYAQSSEKPDWSALPDGYLLETDENPACKAIDRQYEGLRAGKVLSFKLKANPTRKVDTTTKAELAAGAPKSNGRRVFITGAADQLEWLRRKAATSGFELVAVSLDRDVADVDTEPSPWVYGRKQEADSTESRRIAMGSAVFRGHLRVMDADLFRATLANGIGSGKAYGFGFLSVAPAW